MVMPLPEGEPRSRLHAPAVGGEGSGSGVAKFEVATLGQLLRSHEDTTGVPKCKGLARPVFEMKLSQASQGIEILAKLGGRSRQCDAMSFVF